MSRRPDRRATYGDLSRLPENVVGEILDGELTASPRPAPAHALASSAIGAGLFTPFNRGIGDPEGPGGWWILGEPELHLHGDILVPDMAGWRRERLAALPSTAAFELAPDWACEVISPSTVRFDRSRKMPIYARERVGHLWLVDPLARTLEIFRLDGERWTVTCVYAGDEARVRAEPFEAIELDLSRWWTGPEGDPDLR
jgi:Uma2 family endonuclease